MIRSARSRRPNSSDTNILKSDMLIQHSSPIVSAVFYRMKYDTAEQTAYEPAWQKQMPVPDFEGPALPTANTSGSPMNFIVLVTRKRNDLFGPVVNIELRHDPLYCERDT